MIISRISQVFFVALGLLAGACTLLDDSSAKKPMATGLIATPPTYYSTAKARYLGVKYKGNLDRLVERITRNSKTAPLQFANNISSVGGIGFFTHSATKTADERYLEVVLATPETFEIKGEHSEKVQRLFSRYGLELLEILSGDSDIYQDRELRGYGLNLAWRNVVAEANGNRVMLERAIIYFSKERVRSFIRQEIKQNDLLADAVIFAVEEDGPLNLVSFRPQELRPDFRPAIREDNLAAGSVSPSAPETAVAPVLETKASAKLEPVKPEPASVASVKSAPREVKIETKPAIGAAQKSAPVTAKSAAASTTADLSKPAPRARAEEAAIDQPSERRPAVTESVQALRAQPNRERQSEPQPLTSQAATEPATKARVPVVAPKPVEPAPVKEIVIAPTRPSPLPVASKGEAPAEKLEDVGQKSITIAAPKRALEATGAAPELKPVSEMVKPPAPAAVNTEKVFPIKPPMMEPVKAAPAPPPVEVKARQAVTIPPLVVEVPASAPSVEIAKPLAPVNVAKVEPARLEVEGPMPALMAPRQEPIVAPPPVVKTAEPPRQPTVTKPPAPSVETAKPSAPADVAKIATAPPEMKQPLPASVTLKQETITAPAPAVKAAEPQPQAKVTKPPVSVRAAKIDPVPIEVKSAPLALTTPKPEIIAAPVVQPTEPARPVQVAKPVAPVSVARIETPPVIEMKPAPVIVAPVAPSKPSEMPAREQLASLTNKPADVVPPKPVVARPAAKPLEGFIIQLAFNDKEQAQRWAESMEKRGYAVSLTEAGVEGSLRVRLGNFSARDDAERQLRTFKQEGMNGIVINLPQAFRPEARTSIP